MGITIHYAGKLNSESSYEQLVELSVNFAIMNEMIFERFAVHMKCLDRVSNQEEWSYEGPVKGVKIIPSESCEPLWLEFDQNLVVQDFCKTQFADIEVHMLIIGLFEALNQCFENLRIADEGEYWDTRDVNRLRELRDECFELMESAKEQDRTLSGPFRLEDGRIVDLMH
jgi:uncharacterized protein YabN with tetrapyrrole methylase and pyrophosphatase domain